MKKVTALILVISILGLNCASYKRGEGMNLESGQKPGAKIIVQIIDGQLLEGELIAVKETSLLLKESGSGADVTVPLGEISVLSIVRKSQTLKGGVNGAIFGALVGVVAAGSSDSCFDPELAPLISCGIGFLLGATIGQINGSDRIIDLEGLSDKELEQVMNELRALARIPDYR